MGQMLCIAISALILIVTENDAPAKASSAEAKAGTVAFKVASAAVIHSYRFKFMDLELVSKVF
jgi:hypothetical protein